MDAQFCVSCGSPTDMASCLACGSFDVAELQPYSEEAEDLDVVDFMGGDRNA